MISVSRWSSRTRSRASRRRPRQRGLGYSRAERYAMFRSTVGAIGLLAVVTAPTVAQPLSPNGVKTLLPAGAIKPTGTWAVASRAGDFIYIAGMRGIDPKTD